MSKAAPLTFSRATNNTMTAGHRQRGMVYHFERGDVNYQAHAPWGGMREWQVVTICASSGDGRAWRWAKDLTKGIIADVLARAQELHAPVWNTELPVQRWAVRVKMSAIQYSTLYVMSRTPKGAMLKAQRIAGIGAHGQRLAVGASIADDQSGPCDDEPKAEQTAPADVAARIEQLETGAVFTDKERDELRDLYAKQTAPAADDVQAFKAAARADVAASSAVTASEVIELRALFDSIHAHDAAGLSPMDDPLLSELAQMTGDAGRVSAMLGELATLRARAATALDLLEQAGAAIENMLAHHGARMPAADRSSRADLATTIALFTSN